MWPAAKLLSWILDVAQMYKMFLSTLFHRSVCFYEYKNLYPVQFNVFKYCLSKTLLEKFNIPYKDNDLLQTMRSPTLILGQT